MKAIEVEDLSRSFNTLRAVDNISFSVDAGEIFGFLGHNGAGKTTTIRMLSGQLLPSSGRRSRRRLRHRQRTTTPETTDRSRVRTPKSL